MVLQTTSTEQRGKIKYWFIKIRNENLWCINFHV